MDGATEIGELKNFLELDWENIDTSVQGKSATLYAPFYQ